MNTPQDIINIFEEFEIKATLNFSDLYYVRCELSWDISSNIYMAFKRTPHLEEILKRDPDLKTSIYYGRFALRISKSHIETMDLTILYNLAEGLYNLKKDLK